MIRVEMLNLISMEFHFQVLQYLNTVNFTTKEGERVYFNKNGDTPARYELVNLQFTIRGTMEGRTIGIFDASLPERNQFVMNNIPVVWGNGLTEVTQKLKFEMFI